MNLSTLHLAACLLAALSAWPAGARAQLRPTEITLAQSTQLPYRESGKITVQFGNRFYFGTATYVHRYTGLTAGHLLYDPKTGLAINPSFQPGLYDDQPPTQQIGYFAVLAGYQSAAQAGLNSTAAFAQDMGYFVLTTPSPLDEWAAFSSDPTLLTSTNQILDLGYAAKTFSGNELAFVQIDTQFDLTLPGYCQTDAYYIQDGMSGGPIYLNENGAMVIGAVNVAGTDPPEQAESIVRAISADVAPLLIDAEYAHGIITGAVITGPATVAAGSTAIYRTGLTFADGRTEGEGLPRLYEEIALIPQGSAKHFVSVTKFKPERFQLHFASSLRPGTQVTLRMLRDSDPVAGQTPLKTFIVTIQ